MAARTDGVSARVAVVEGSTVADANARDHRPAAASTAPRASTDGGTLGARRLRQQRRHYGVCCRLPVLLDLAEGPHSDGLRPTLDVRA